MALTFLNQRPAPGSSVESVESRLGVRLPDAYRELLLVVSNGGEVEPVVSLEFPAVGLAAILGVERGDHLDIEARISEYKSGRLPEGLVPVADAEGGNLVCVSVRPEDFGTVWFWDHELELIGEAATLIAADLGAFFADLAPVAQIDEPSAITEAWIDPAFLKEFEGGDG